MALDPFDEGLLGLQRQVELIAIVGNERDAEQLAAVAIIFGVQEITH